MNLLLTLRQPLVPADTGGKIRSLNLFSRLAKRVSIHAVSFANPVDDASAVSEMNHIFDRYTPVPWREERKYSPEFYGRVLAAQMNPWPYFLSKCNRPEFAAAIQTLERQHRFDLLFCDFLHTAAPLLHHRFRPKVVFEHNIEFLLRKRKSAVEKNPLRKWLLKREWTKTRVIEEQVCRSCEHVFVVSQDDRSTVAREFGVSHTSALATAVDTDFFSPMHKSVRAQHLAFVGSMDWEPNEDAMIWFLQEVYPRIRRSAPNASLAIVGRHPSARLRRLAGQQPNVEVTGRVDDVRPYLAEAEVIIVPLRVGGGTRIKIPEAMAMAKAVVSTTVGAEGLPFHSGRDICIADQPGDFAEAVLMLLRDRAMRESIGEAARKIVVEKHRWDAVVDQLQDALHRLVPCVESPKSAKHIPSPRLYA